jgi:UDP-N-acetylglucosamine acyltransferase
MPIHATAVVASQARIDPTADIGPYCVIGPHVTIGAHTRLLAHVVVDHRTTLGAHNVVHPFATLGGPPQDLKYAGEPAELVVGDHNVIRENVTLNIGTRHGRMRTEVGSHCLLMAYAHVAHDCLIGDHVILANSVGLAGHVDIDDRAIVGGLAAVHQHCRVGRLAFVGGGSMVAQDVLPFCTAQGDRALLAGPNVVGLRRAGWDPTRIRGLRRALRDLFETGRSRQRALALLEETHALESDDIAELCRFVRSAQRGVCALRASSQQAQVGTLQAADAC